MQSHLQQLVCCPRSISILLGILYPFVCHMFVKPPFTAASRAHHYTSAGPGSWFNCESPAILMIRRYCVIRSYKTGCFQLPGRAHAAQIQEVNDPRHDFHFGGCPAQFTRAIRVVKKWPADKMAQIDVRIDKCMICDTIRYIPMPTKSQNKSNLGKAPEPLDPKVHCNRDLRAGLTFQVCAYFASIHYHG
jgi:hypothetical protein